MAVALERRCSGTIGPCHCRRGVDGGRGPVGCACLSFCLGVEVDPEAQPMNPRLLGFQKPSTHNYPELMYICPSDWWWSRVQVTRDRIWSTERSIYMDALSLGEGQTRVRRVASGPVPPQREL